MNNAVMSTVSNQQINILKTIFSGGVVNYKKDYQKVSIPYDYLLNEYKSIYLENSIGNNSFGVSIVKIRELIEKANDFYLLPIDIDLKNWNEDWLTVRDNIISVCNNELSNIVTACFVTKSGGLHIWIKVNKKSIGSEYLLSLFYLAVISYFEKIFNRYAISYELSKNLNVDIKDLNSKRVVDNLVINSDLTFSNKQITLLSQFSILKRDVNGIMDFKSFILKNQNDYHLNDFILEISGYDNRKIFDINLDVNIINDLLRSNDGRGKIVRIFYYFYGNEYEIRLKDFLEKNKEKLTALQEKKIRLKELFMWLKNSKNKIMNTKVKNIKSIINGKIKEKQLINFEKIDINGYLTDIHLKPIFDNTNKIILSGSTGLGKTTALIDYSLNNKENTLLVVPNVSIIMSLHKKYGEKIEFYFNTDNHKEYSNLITYPNEIFKSHVYVITYEKFTEILTSPFLLVFYDKFKNLILDEFHQVNRDAIINFVQRFSDKNKRIVLSSATANKLFYLEKYYSFKAYYFNNVNRLEVKKNAYLLNEKKTKTQRLNVIKNLIDNGNKVILFYENNKRETEKLSEILKQMYHDWKIELFNSENKPNSFDVKEKTIILCTSSLISGANLYLENNNIIPTYVIFDGNVNLDTITQISGRFRNQKEYNIIYVNKLNNEYDLKPIVTDKQIAIKNILSVTNFQFLERFKELKYIMINNNEYIYNDVLYVFDVYNKSNNKLSSKEFIDIMNAKIITNKNLITKNELNLINSNENKSLDINEEDLGSEISIKDLELSLNFVFNEKQKENIIKYFNKNKIENCLPITWIKDRILLEKITDYMNLIKKLDFTEEIMIPINYEKSFKDYSYVLNNKIINLILNNKLLKKYIFDNRVIKINGIANRYYVKKTYYEPFIEFFLSEVVNLDRETINKLVC